MKYEKLTIKTPIPENALDPDSIAKVGEGTISIGSGYDKSIVMKRTDGEFTERALYLPDTFDWVLGEDSTGSRILVPIKKKW